MKDRPVIEDRNKTINDIIEQVKPTMIPLAEQLLDMLDEMSRTDHREFYSRLEVILTYLLKWDYQPLYQSGSWASSIRKNTNELQRILEESPSMKKLLRDSGKIATAYRKAVEIAEDETGLHRTAFPKTLPYDIEKDILNQKHPFYNR